MSKKQELATLAQLFPQKPTRRYRHVTLPVTQCVVRIQSWTEREYSRWQAQVAKAGTEAKKRARLEDATRRAFVLSLVDEEGNRILTDSHMSRLSEWDVADSTHLYNEVAEHCALNQEELEDLVKNSEETPADKSPSP